MRFVSLVGSDVTYCKRVVCLAVVYAVVARLSLSLWSLEGYATMVWPASGIALAALVVFGRTLWPGILVGAFLANLSAGDHLGPALGIAFGNMLGAVFGATLLGSAGFDSPLDSLADVFKLIVLGATSTLASATIGVGSLVLGHVTPLSAFGGLWLVWWIGDTLGVLVVAPLLLATLPREVRPDEVRGTPTRRLESMFLGVLLIGLSGYAFTKRDASTFFDLYMLFPLLIWAPLRFRLRGATMASATVATIALAGTFSAVDPFIARRCSRVCSASRLS